MGYNTGKEELIFTKGMGVPEMKRLKILIVILALSLLSAPSAFAAKGEFFASSDLFLYFVVNNQGLMELDEETGETVMFDEYGENIHSVVLLDSGDLLLNLDLGMRSEIIRTDLFGHEETLFTLSDVDDPESGWIYHMRRFGDKIYVALSGGTIYEMDQDGSHRRKLTDDGYLFDFTVLGTDLYFCDGTALYRLDLQQEDSEPQVVVNEIVDAVEVYDGEIYFTYGKNRALCRLGEGENQAIELIPENVSDFTLYYGGKRVAYISRGDWKLRIFDLEAGSELMRFDVWCSDLAADGDTLYFKTIEEEGKNKDQKYSVFKLADDGTAIPIGGN